MCIIIHKRPDAKFPTKQQLKDAWDANPHGAGFMYVEEDAAVVHKGFMNFKDLWRAYRERKFPKDTEMVFHFRWATSGWIDEETTHPFPIINKDKLLRVLDYRAKQVIAHNGVIKGQEEDKDLSDTQVFIKGFLWNLAAWMHKPKVLKAIEHASTGSRLLIFNNGKISKTGNWYTDKTTGLSYSNTRRMKHTTRIVHHPLSSDD